MARIEFHGRHYFGPGFKLDAAFDTSAVATALFGPSGAGKTTILECIAGVNRLDDLRITVDDDVLADTSQRIWRAPEQRRIALVFQDQLLFPHLSVARNLRYGENRGSNHTQVEFDRVVDVLEIRPLLGRNPRTLSGGERQRVALGRAVISRPRVLLLDEPLTALDDALRDRVMTYLERILNEWAIPTLFVTHSQAEVRRLAEAVVVISAGEVVATGSPEGALASAVPMGWRDTLGPVNVLRVTKLRTVGDHWIGHLAEQSVRLPADERPPSDPSFVAFAPSAVVLSRAAPTKVSTQNALRGVVTRVETLPHAAFVAVDVGQPIWSEVTPEAVQQLELCAGCEVLCLVKTQSMRLLR